MKNKKLDERGFREGVKAFLCACKQQDVQTAHEILRQYPQLMDRARDIRFWHLKAQN